MHTNAGVRRHWEKTSISDKVLEGRHKLLRLLRRGRYKALIILIKVVENLIFCNFLDF